MKKTIALTIAAMAAVQLLTACGEKIRSVSMYDLNQSMQQAVSFSDMKYVSSAENNAEDLFANVSEMDYGKVQGFFIYYAANGTGNADELVAIQVKKPADIAEATASLKAHLEKRRALYATYDKSQLGKLDEGRVVTKNGVAALIVCDDADKAEQAFYDFFA